MCALALIPDASIFSTLWIVAGIFLFTHRLSDQVWYPKSMKHPKVLTFKILG